MYALSIQPQFHRIELKDFSLFMDILFVLPIQSSFRTFAELDKLFNRLRRLWPVSKMKALITINKLRLIEIEKGQLTSSEFRCFRIIL